jgi:nucleotide-binding universal stress UspA family protein
MRYLVAVDGSEQSDAALEHALAMAGEDDGVAVAHAVDPDVYSRGGSEPLSDLDDASERLLIETVEDAERRGEDLLEDAAALAEDHGVAVATELLYGDPLEVLHDHAVREGYDHLVVGHRGLSERAEAVAGSVAKGIVSRTTLPVTVVP